VGDTAGRFKLTRLGIDIFKPATTRFHAEESVLGTIRQRLEWAERQRLIRSFTCDPSTPSPTVVTIEWWDPIDEPVQFTRAHDHRGTGSAWGDE
jgi:hypothetical protein